MTVMQLLFNNKNIKTIFIHMIDNFSVKMHYTKTIHALFYTTSKNVFIEMVVDYQLSSHK